MGTKNDVTILLLSIPTAILTAVVSYAGVFIEGTYSKETANYAAQGIGQDYANLILVVPALLMASFFAYRNSKLGLFVWSGVMFYLAYSYATLVSSYFLFQYLREVRGKESGIRNEE